MKKFVNKKTGIKTTSESGKNESYLTYADLATMSLNNAPQGGWEISQMRRRLKVVDKLEKAKVDKAIELEDAEFDTLLECSKIKWRFMHKDIIAYDDYLQELNKS